MLTIFHATISILIPIAIVELLWPEYRNIPLLKKKGMFLSFVGIMLMTAFWIVLIFIGAQSGLSGPNFFDYNPNSLLIIGSIIIIFLLIWLAYKYRNSRISTDKVRLRSPYIFGIFGFLFMAFNLFMPNILAGSNVPAKITITAQLIFILLTLLFVIFQLFHNNITKRHITSLIFGNLLFWILLTPIYEFNLANNPDPTQGMLIVGILVLIFLIIWRRIVLKKEEEDLKIKEKYWVK